jgi:acetyl-CoA acetyltransferase
VQALIGAKKAVAFDVTAACSGFVIGVVTAAQFVRTGMHKTVLVIGADALSRYVDWRDRCKHSEDRSAYQGAELWHNPVNKALLEYLQECRFGRIVSTSSSAF